MQKTVANLAAIGLAVSTIFAHHFMVFGGVLSLYGLLVIGYVVSKIVLSEIYRYRLRTTVGEPIDLEATVDVAIAFYNEDPDLLCGSIESVLAQTGVKIGRIIAVDDGSGRRRAADLVATRFAGEPRVMVFRSEANGGKRHALAAAFRQLRSPYAALLDSDTVLAPDAIEALVRRMAPDVAVTTANVVALNRDDNWLSRLIDARYRNAFTIERAAQSMTGAVLCASGVLSLYRTEFLQRTAPAWAEQQFLGRPVQFGDDRNLTARALKEGKSVIALDAIAATAVPTSPYVFFKQQLRWNKSFLRESVLIIADRGVLSWPGFLAFSDLYFWFFYLAMLINAALIDHTVGIAALALVWFAYVIGAGLFRNLPVIVREPRLVFLAPLYSVLHVVILTPLRLIALSTMLDTRWGTR